MKKSYRFLIQWLVIALFSGIIGCFSIQLVLFLCRLISGGLAGISSVPLFVWPAAGALIVGFFIYRLEPRAKGEGIPSYIVGIKDNSGELSISVTIFKFFAAVFTLGTFGNGGYLGPGGRFSAGILSAAGRVLPQRFTSEEHRPLYAVCGLAAAFASLVHSPIGAGIFAVEIIQKSSMRYKQLFPAVLAASVSVIFTRLFGFEAVFSINTAAEGFDVRISGLIILVCIAAGLEGRGFTLLYAGVSRLFHRNSSLSHNGVAVRAFIGSALAALSTAFINPALLGTSPDIFRALTEGRLEALYGNIGSGVPLVLVILIIIIVKAAANSLTVGSGMSAGFAGPAMLLGLLCGAFFAAMFNIEAGTAEYYALLAAGFSGVFSSTMNTPIAVSILTVELFGMGYSIPAGLAAVIGFQVNRHHTLYDMVFEEEDDDW